MKNKNEKIDANKFILNKDNKSYDLIIEKIEDTIFIKCLPYQVKFDTGNISWGRDSQNASYRAIFLIVDLKVGDELSFRMYNSQSGFISGRSYYIGRWESK